MKLIVFILALAAISYVVYNRLENTKGVTTVDANGNVIVQPGQQNPQKQLDNVRGAADRMQKEQQERANKAEGMAGGLATPQ